MRTLTAALASFVLLYPAPAHADAVHEALEAYALYQNDVSALLDLELDSGQAIDTALARLSRHNPERVSRGWIAYGALTAAQSPAFAAGVERRVRDQGREPVLRQLRSDLSYARRQPAGSAQAIRLILSTASADSARAASAGARYDGIARSNAAWLRSTARRTANVRGASHLTPEMRERLQVGALAERPLRDADAFGGRRFWDSLAGREASAPRGRGSRERRDYSPVTDHMLTLGALVVAGAADSERRRVSALLDEPLTQSCLEMQRLQLRQCVSVSHDVSERAYCVGRHGLSGPGGCFGNVVG
jgi:hypothetical protein